MGIRRADLLAAVECSPTAAAAHDRAAWVGLFTLDGRVEDPVGSRPHCGHTRIGRFYDTFIGPRDITFHRDLDIVVDDSVIRDLRLEVAMGPQVIMHIPAILRYDLREENRAVKLTRLRAYWELPAMVAQFLGNGTAALPAGLALSQALLTNQGPTGTAGFVAGFRRPGRAAVRQVRTLVADLAAGRTPTTLAPAAALTRGDRTPVGVADLAERLRGATATKVIAAGSTVAVSTAGPAGRAVLFAEPGRRGGGVGAVRYFPAEPVRPSA